MRLAKSLDNIIRIGIGRHNFICVDVPDGYNCRGILNIGDYVVEAIFDTGATRNSINQALSQRMEKGPNASGAFRGRYQIDDIQCIGFTRDNAQIVNQLSAWECRFSESPTISATHSMPFVECPNMTEDMLIGKPSLDVLGFFSNDEFIELATLGITIPLIREASQGRQTQNVVRTSRPYVLTESPA